jgi:hypothetical protein
MQTTGAGLREPAAMPQNEALVPGIWQWKF